MLVAAGDPKDEIALGDMGVHGEHAPLDAVGAGSNGLEAHLEHVRARLIRLGRPPVDSLAALVQDFEGAEGGLEPFREPDPNLSGRDLDRAAHAWLSSLEKGVGRRRARSEEQRHQDKNRAPSHRTYRPKSGRPSVLGKMSSRKKCTWPRMPTFLPVRSFTGTTASSPSWKYLPAQMMPGLMVPVVLPANPRSSGLLMSISTRGMSCLMMPGSPTSRTKDCRYGRLYITAKPQ